MARARHHEAAATADRPPDRFEPINPTHPLPPEADSPEIPENPSNTPPPPVRGFKQWCKRHIWPSIRSNDNNNKNNNNNNNDNDNNDNDKNTANNKPWDILKHHGRRLHKEPPPNHPSRALPQPQPHIHNDDEAGPGVEEPAQPPSQAPLPARSPSRASTFGLSSLINNLKHDTERCFLTSLEKEVYRYLTLVTTGTGHLASASLGEFGGTAAAGDEQEYYSSPTATPRKLWQRSSISRGISPRIRKELLCRDLSNFVVEEQRAVLRTVLFRDVEIHCGGYEEGVRVVVPPSWGWQRETRSLPQPQPVLRPSPARRGVVTEAARARGWRALGLEDKEHSATCLPYFTDFNQKLTIMGSTGSEAARIPVIDIRPSNADAPKQLLDAATRYGFVFIENNEIGIAPEDIDHMFDLSQQFFASPIDLKQEVSISSNKAGKNHGWLSRGVEKLDPSTQQRPDVKDHLRAFNLGEPLNNTLPQPLPAPLKPHAQTLLTFQTNCQRLSHSILRLVAVALDLDENWFTLRHSPPGGGGGKPSGTIFRMLYYPQLDDDEKNSSEHSVEIRAGAHSDYESLTLLFQQPGQPGLEIRMPSGEWAGVPVNPHVSDTSRSTGSEEAGVCCEKKTQQQQQQRALPILVNIGDLLEDWTGGLLKSTVHRVVFPPRGGGGQGGGGQGGGGGGDRYSMAYFCHPLDEALLEPVPSRLVREHAEKTGRSGRRGGKVITARDHLMERLAATYTVK
ncbi:hypothetical protein B0A55_07504 [Friedmanniomyces simplex]|uniref:Fe2OG dioxygenase domain-containing protein n=1 Tax=Friedmanniomyces simplex TaxID=329884 RepID=A0A4U0X491_9PEZI|nr:hypothetical protein B0A55_07504 [Friedmanniomyces simplex]